MGILKTEFTRWDKIFVPLVLTVSPFWGCWNDGDIRQDSGGRDDYGGNYDDSGYMYHATEVCDGLDNDGDGLIDEGFDLNSDDIGDCFQCQVDIIDAYHVGSTESCAVVGGYPKNFEAIDDVWSYSPDFNEYEPAADGCSNPRVADLDGDQTGDILCSGGYSNSVYSLNGVNGEMMWSFDESADFVVSAMGDYDSDGWIDVAIIGEDGYLVVFDGFSGGEINVSRSEIRAVPLGEDWAYECGLHGYEPYISTYVFSVDFDKDGDWEIMAPAGVFDPVGGSLIYEFSLVDDYCEWGNFLRNGFDIGFVGYFDDVKYAFFDGVYGLDESNLFRAEIQSVSDEKIYNLFGMSFTGFMFVQADYDDGPEFVVHDHEGMFVFDSSGELLSSWNVTGNKYRIVFSTGCAGDVNGDGISEVFVPVTKYPEYMGVSASAYMGAWSIDGTLLWSRDIGLYGTSSCATFDFDNDGSDELMFSDQDYFYIVSGVDGELLYSYERKGTSSWDWVGQIGIWSMVVDLDGDGSVELINASPFAMRGGEPAVRVLSHAEGAFPPGGRIWPWHSWSGAGMHWDGRPQNDQPGSWLYPGRHRGQAQVHVDGSDLQPFVYDSCVAEAEVRLSVGIENLGPYGLGGTLLLEALDEAGTVVASHAFLTALEPGYRTETVEWVFSPEAVQQGLTIRVSTDVSPDCNVHNNTLHWTPDDAASQ